MLARGNSWSLTLAGTALQQVLCAKYFATKIMLLFFYVQVSMTKYLFFCELIFLFLLLQ